MALTHTYVGYQGPRSYYSWSAAPIIRRIFERFDEQAADAFVKCIKESPILHSRLGNRSQLERLRNLGNILLERTNPKSSTHKMLALLTDESKEKEFYRTIKK